MKLPGKSTPYKTSIMALFPPILSALKEDDLAVSDLFDRLDTDYGSYIAALDCLYALGRVEICERRMLHYVDRDTL
ncbi:MAG: hypothetical protein IJI45_04195 [Anaerolineaceae bacterium]|nr:hypothetical protein [Anaerolineaceae bacterium]